MKYTFKAYYKESLDDLVKHVHNDNIANKIPEHVREYAVEAIKRLKSYMSRAAIKFDIPLRNSWVTALNNVIGDYLDHHKLDHVDAKVIYGELEELDMDIIKSMLDATPVKESLDDLIKHVDDDNIYGTLPVGSRKFVKKVIDALWYYLDDNPEIDPKVDAYLQQAWIDNLESTSKTTYPISSLVFKYWPTMLILFLDITVLMALNTPGTFL